MGYDKLLYFFSRSISNFCLEINNDNSKGIIPASYIYFDMNFIIYQSINTVEDDINYIIKILLSLKYTVNLNYKEKLEKILNNVYWKKFKNDILEVFNNCNNIEKSYIIFLELIYKINNEVLFSYVKTFLLNKIEIVNIPILVKKVLIYFDGIPTYSKILEQRRRRIKTYIESQKKKEKYNELFKKVKNNIFNEDDLYYSYLDWNNYKFVFDKALGPNSKLFLDLEEYLKREFTEYKLHISSSSLPGEADFKIFNSIKKINNEDVCIHSCDSDFIFLSLLFQLKFYSENKDLNLTFVKYNHQKFNIIEASNCLNLILEKYNQINKIADNSSFNIIYDILFLIMFFGNDILPNSLEIGTELPLKIILKIHYELFENKSFIINFKTKRVINLINLKKFIKKLVNYNSEIYVILHRYFKVNNNLVEVIANELKYNINDFLNKILIPYRNFHDNDNKNNPLKKIPEKISTKLEEYLDNNIYYENYGLNKLKKILYYNDNKYENFYNLITHYEEKSINNDFLKPYPYNFTSLKELINIKNDKNLFNVEKYMELIIYYSYIFFYDFNLFSYQSLVYYGYMLAPNLESIVNYLETVNINILDKVFKNLKLKTTIYFDKLSHQLLITPYLINSKYLEKYNISNLNLILKKMDFKLDNLMYEINKKDFNIKNIDPIKYLLTYNYIIKTNKYNFNLLLL